MKSWELRAMHPRKRSKKFIESHYLLFLGIAYLFISIIDLLHTLAYTGMNIFTGPRGYPGVVLGMGFLTAWVTTPLFGTIWILMIAYMVHFLPTENALLNAC